MRTTSNPRMVLGGMGWPLLRRAGIGVRGVVQKIIDFSSFFLIFGSLLLGSISELLNNANMFSNLMIFVTFHGTLRRGIRKIKEKACSANLQIPEVVEDYGGAELGVVGRPAAAAGEWKIWRFRRNQAWNLGSSELIVGLASPHRKNSVLFFLF